MEQIIDLYDAQNTSTGVDQTIPLTNGKRRKTISADHFLSGENAINLKQHYQEERKTVNVTVKPRTNKLKFGKKIYEFYNAPITKFWQNIIFYIIFLLCLSYMILVKTPRNPTGVEIFVLIYVFSYGFDKIREVRLKI